MTGGMQRFVKANRPAKIWSTYVPYAVGISSNAGFNIALISLLTHRLAPTVYGDYSVAVTAIVLTSSVAGQWLQQATGRYLAGSSTRTSAYTKAALLLGISGIMLTLAVLYVISALIELLNRTAGTELWRVAIIAVAAQTLFTLIGTALQSEQRAWSYAFQQALCGSLKIAFSILVCRALEQSIGGLLYALAAAQCIGVAFGASQAGLFERVVLEKLKSHRVWIMLRKLRAYGGAMTLWFIFMNLAMYCDRLLVRALAGPATAGLYGAASTLVVGSVNLVMAPVLAATWPRLMAAWNMQNEQAATLLLGNLLTGLLCAGVALVSLVSAVAEPATHLFLGERFAAATSLLPLLVASAFSFALGPFFHKPLEFKEKKTTMCVIAASVLLLNVLLSVALTPRFGAVGAGVAALLAGSTYCWLATRRGRKIVRWRIRFDMLVIVIGAGGVASVAVNRFSTSWHFDSTLLKLVAASLAFITMFGAGSAAAILVCANFRRPQTQTFE
jgi:O-antigen/teichoic acid export membrane protein